MNFLTHLHFSNENKDNLKGLIIGNTFKSYHLPKYNLDLLKGIAINMQIKIFSDTHIAFNRSVNRINPKYSKHAAFIVNVFYDHLLAKNWGNYSRIPLEEFAEKIYSAVNDDLYSYPYKIRKFAPEMVSKKWITSTTTLEGTHQYFKLLSKTERFTYNLDQCLFELIENYQNYNNDFKEYFAALSDFMREEAIRFNTITSEKEILLLSA